MKTCLKPSFSGFSQEVFLVTDCYVLFFIFFIAKNYELSPDVQKRGKGKVSFFITFLHLKKLFMQYFVLGFHGVFLTPCFDMRTMSSHEAISHLRVGFE